MSDTEPKVNRGVQLAPAMHVTPGPVTANVASQPLPNGDKVIFLHLEHSTGSTIVCLNPEFARSIAEQLIESATGLTIPTPSSLITKTDMSHG